MNCQSAREHLSAFYDRELSPDVEVAVSEHLQSCAECARRLSEFEELSNLAADMRQPEVPQRAWAAIDAALVGQGGDRTPLRGRRWWTRAPRMTIAAVVLLAIALALFAYWPRHVHDAHAEMAVTFQRYLNELHERPEQAQRVLIERYDGRLIDPQRALDEVRFEPHAPQQLPDGFARLGIYVLNMPCCKCTQTIYQDQAGHVLAIFEHAEDQRIWFGGRPAIRAHCHGKQTNLVELRDGLAASWKLGSRYVTVIGARNVEQVAELVAYLDG